MPGVAHRGSALHVCVHGSLHSKVSDQPGQFQSNFCISVSAGWRLVVCNLVRCVFCCARAGDQIGGGGLPAACSHGLSRRSAHPHAGLLAEGSQREAPLLPDRHRSGQANPQSGEPEVHGHALQVGGPPGPVTPAFWPSVGCAGATGANTWLR